MPSPDDTPPQTHYPQLDRAREQFDTFLAAMPPGKPVTILCDGDVDGLGAGVVLWHLLTRRGTDPANITVLQPDKGENAFTPTTRGYVARAHPRTLFVDHHRPSGEPPGAVVISGYEGEPVPTSSLLTYLVCNAHGEVSDKAWVAALGNLGDLGPPHPELQAAAREQKLKWVREATTLLNSAKRCSMYPLVDAFVALRDAESAQAIVEGTSPQLDTLRQCRAEVKAELAEAKRLAPRFSKTEKVALFELDSPARIHPLLAQSWRGRLPKFIVLVANRGFLPGRVAFSARTQSEANLLDFLARYRDVVPGELEYGYGHDQAAGGVVSADAWDRLKSAMGL
jgi:single-stranded DNA-specific DHH superfamily exonuclease